MFMPSFFIKLIELTIAAACLVLQQYSYDLTDVPTLILCSGTYMGFILVLTGEIIGEMVFAPLDVIQDVYFSVLGMAMFGTCGWILYTARSDPERNPRTDDTYAMYSAGLAAANVLVMLCDMRVSAVSTDAPCRTCEMIRGKQDPFVEAWWSSAGAALFGSCAARTLLGWRHVPESPRRERARAAAICALVATSVLIVDAIRVLCADDGFSIASSEHKKLTKARAPTLGFDLGGNYNNAPICISNLSPLRLNPARLPTKEIPMNIPDIGFNSKNTPLLRGVPKLSPQKLPLSKLPMTCRPLRMAPKVNRSFW